MVPINGTKFGNIFEVEIVPINQIIHKFGNGIWTLTHDGKEVYVFEQPIWTWSDIGWTRLTNIIRHELSPNKKMMRILTPRGLVDVTDDHSLLNIQGQEISPRDVDVGAELLHYQLPMKDCYFNWLRTIPFTNDYYKNLTIQDFVNNFDFYTIFKHFGFAVNSDSHDLYFWGKK